MCLSAFKYSGSFPSYALGVVEGGGYYETPCIVGGPLFGEDSKGAG